MYNTNGSAIISLKGVGWGWAGEWAGEQIEFERHTLSLCIVIGPENHKHYLQDVALGNGLKADSGFPLGYFVARNIHSWQCIDANILPRCLPVVSPLKFVYDQVSEPRIASGCGIAIE